MLPVEQPFKTYSGLDGKPLDNGYVYFGLPDQDPITHPVAVYWDAEGTLPAAQPLRTVNGYITRVGTPANVFVDSPYSVLVWDSKKRQVFYARTSEEFSIATLVNTFLNNIRGGNGADLIGFAQAGVGAAVRTALSKMRERVSAFDFMTEDEIEDVRSRAFTLNVAPAVQKAIDYASSKRATLVVPGGLYKLVPATPINDEDTSYVTLAALIMRSNLHVEAEPGAVFKIADGVSSDAGPRSMGMLCTTAVLENVSIRNLDMDMNGANNKISPLRPATYNRYNQSMILVSGTQGGVAARIDNMVLEHNVFRNNPGVCCVCVAQSNVPGVALGKNWKINYNRFTNNGLDSDDHTAVFAWANDVQFIGNDVDNDFKFHETGKTGGNTGYEIHGIRHKIIGNKFRNYYRGIWVRSNLSDPFASDSIIALNHFQCAFYGVDFFRTLGTLGQPRNTIIANNTFEFDSYTFPGAPQQRSCVNIASEYAQKDVLVVDNIAESSDTVVGAVFCTVTPQKVPGQTHTNIIVRGNKARGFVHGVNFRTNDVNGLGYLAVQDNTWHAPLTTPVFAVAMGEFIDPVSTIRTLLLTGNSMVNDGGVVAPGSCYGTYINGGSIENLHYDGAFCKDTAAGYYEAAPLAGTKSGTFESQAFTPVFRAGGTAFEVGDGETVGRYSMHGKQVIVNCTLVVGSTTTIPVGSLTVDLPVAAGWGDHQFLGQWRIFEIDPTKFHFGAAEVDGTAAQASLQLEGSTFATSDAPVDLAPGDRISVQISYTRP